jgi:DNA-directed RNA polymerase subunit M/transcription elongation factor TFIIS
MNRCPKCGHEYPAKNQSKGGKNRWKGMTKKQRSEEAKKAADARWAKTKKKK